jgi:hypothetical protein
MLKRRTATGISVLAATAGMSMGALAAMPAHAATYPPPVTSVVDPTTTSTTIGTEVLGETATNDPAVGGSGLAVTGGDVLGLIAIGGAAAIGGTALVRFSRRKSEA